MRVSVKLQENYKYIQTLNLSVPVEGCSGDMLGGKKANGLNTLGGVGSIGASFGA
jgi:hypothetical protein